MKRKRITTMFLAVFLAVNMMSTSVLANTVVEDVSFELEEEKNQIDDGEEAGTNIEETDDDAFVNESGSNREDDAADSCETNEEDFIDAAGADEDTMEIGDEVFVNEAESNGEDDATDSCETDEEDFVDVAGADEDTMEIGDEVFANEAESNGEEETLEVNSETVLTDRNDWLLSSAYYDEEQECFILTEDNKTWEVGSIWYNYPYYNEFTLEMDYYTGSSERLLSGADGIAVAFYANYDYKMTGGEEMGFNGSGGYGIELDTYQNNRRGDPGYNHIALIKESVGNHLAIAPLPESEDEQWHHLKIVVEDGMCSAYVDGTLKISHEVETTDYGWIGITSATGDGTNLHAVKNIAISGENESPDTDVYLDVSLSSQKSMEMKCGDDYYYGYEITAKIKNYADAEATNMQAILDLPEELSVNPPEGVTEEADELSRSIGALAPGESAETTWTVYAKRPDASMAAVYGVTANINDTVSLRQEDYIYLDAKEDSTFAWGIDQWNFSNSGKYFTDGKKDETYYMTETDYQVLMSKFRNLEADKIKTELNTSWGGSCYGMSATAILTKMGIISPDRIVSGSESLYSIKKTNNDSVESFINFYYAQQFADPVFFNKLKFALMETKDQLKELEEKASQVTAGGNPVLLSFYGEKGGHAVVAYGVEHGSYSVGILWNKKEYDSRILIYDCNYPDEETYLYYNTGTDDWYLPKHPDANMLTRACNELALLDYINYGTATDNYIANMVFSRIFTLIYKNKEISIDASTDDRENGMVVFSDDNLMADGTSSEGNLTVTLPSLTDDYSVIPGEEGGAFSLRYENAALSAECESADQIDFGADGNVSAEGIFGEYSLALAFNEGYHTLPWYKTSISGADSEHISLEQTEAGMLIEGSRLQNVEAAVTDRTETKTLTFSTNQDSALLVNVEEQGEDTPVILLDLDDDGEYETVYHAYTITFDPNGGAVDTKTAMTGEDGKIKELPVPTRSEYTFAGWYTAADGGERITENTVFTENAVVYAHWTRENKKPGDTGSSGGDSNKTTGKDSSHGDAGEKSAVNSEADGYTSVTSSLKAANTGDDSHIALWSVLILILSGILVFVVHHWRKDKNC